MKILVVGIGSIGSRHIKNLVEIGYNNIVIVDNNPVLLNQFSNKFTCYSNYLPALRNEKPDIVFICTPTELHTKQALLALKFNCDVFIEKPISHTTENIDILKSYAKNKIVMIGCNWRFNKAFKAFERSLKNASFGKVLYVRIACGYYLPTARPYRDYKKIYASKKRGGGVLLDTGSHILNYLIAIFGDIEIIISLKNPINSLGIQSDEITHLIIRHKSGITCDISMDYVSKKTTNRIEAITDKGSLTLDLVSHILNFNDGINDKILFNKKLDTNEMFVNELRYFFQCVKNRTQPLQGINEAKKVLDAILKGEKNEKNI